MTSRNSGLMALALLLASQAAPALASDNPTMDAAVEQVEHGWERIKYQVTDPGQQHRQIKALSEEAAAVVARYPGRAEPLIWQGIVKSEEAAMSSGLSALGDAKAARHLFETAYQLNRRALDGGAATSLGTLFDRVPGFPIGFGDKKVARRYLEEGVAIAPDGMDANYFYGDFLASQGDNAGARKVLMRALASPPHPDRPVWDAGRRVEIRKRLADVNAKLKVRGG